jgi:hypothetical protein
MKRNSFIRELQKRKYLFIDDGDTITITGVDPSKRLNSVQNYGLIDLGSIESLPRGVVFSDTVNRIIMPRINIYDIPNNTVFLNTGPIVIGGPGVPIWISSKINDRHDINIEDISGGRLLTSMVRSLGKK